MKEKTERYLPWLLIMISGLRIAGETFPNRIPLIGGAHHGWVFWALGLAGILWPLIRSLSRDDVPVEQVQGKGFAAFLRRYQVEAVILLLTAASLSMLIRSGYFWDDAVNSTAYLAEKKDGIPTLRHVLDFMMAYLRLGRINVLSAYYYFFFYIENVSVYKALIILLILGNQLIFRTVLLEFGFSLKWARIGMLLIPILLQTRAYQDPVSGFYGLMQVLTAEMLLCAFFLSRWIREGKKRHLVFSLVCFGFGLMTYEVCFPFLALICLLLWVRHGSFRRALRDSLPFILLVVVMLAGVVLVRANFVTRTYEGVKFSLNPERILRAALRQITAALPLRFYSAGYMAAVMDLTYPASSFMNYDLHSVLKAVRLSDLLILAAAFWCFGCAIRSGDPKRITGTREALVLGGSFALLPVITVALSDRYQGQLMPGLGYLPVYMQYYGIAVLILCLCRFLSEKIGSSAGLRALGLGLFSVILLLNIQNNRGVTEIMNRNFYHSRNAGEAALRGGILDFLPEGSVLISDNDRRYLWEADWNNRGLYPQFYGNYSKHTPASVGDTKLLKPLIEAALAEGAEADEEGYITLAPENFWLIAYNGDGEQGLARLGRVRELSVSTSGLDIKHEKVNTVLYFISGVHPEKSGVQYMTADGQFRQTGTEGFKRVRVSEGGILYALPEEESILFDSLSFDMTIF